MLDNAVIKNADELEFAVFCIENIAIWLGKNAEDIYRALTGKSNILNSYIIPEYEILHTQSKDYIVDDIISLMKERGIRVWSFMKGVNRFDCQSYLTAKKNTHGSLNCFPKSNISHWTMLWVSSITRPFTAWSVKGYLTCTVWAMNIWRKNWFLSIKKKTIAEKGRTDAALFRWI